MDQIQAGVLKSDCVLKLWEYQDEKDLPTQARARLYFFLSFIGVSKPESWLVFQPLFLPSLIMECKARAFCQSRNIIQ